MDHLTAATGAAAVAELCLLCALFVEAPIFAGLALVAVAILGGAAEAAGATWPATPFEAAAFCLAGVLFAVRMGTGALLLALPIFITAISLALGTSPGDVGDPSGDPLTLALPGTHVALAGVDAAFLGVYGAWALRWGLRLSTTATGLVLALAVAAATGGDVPALPLLGAAFLLPNADRIWRLFRAEVGR
jgi:hypothetical protein